MNAALARADRLDVTADRDGAVVRIDHDVDGARSRGRTKFNPGSSGLVLDAEEVRALTAAVSIVLAQHYLPAHLVMQGHAAAHQPVAGLLNMLYDIRACVDRTSFHEPPLITGLNAPTAQPQREHPLARRVVVLLSGGYDSTTSCLALQAAGFDVHALHVASNTHVVPFERAAAVRVAETLNVPLAVVELDLPAPAVLGRQYTATLDEFPASNAIPHGRDLPLMVLGAAYARRVGASIVALSHDREARERQIPYRGRSIDRHDVESVRGIGLSQDFITASGMPDIQLFSPLAGASIHRIRQRLLAARPDLAAIVQSCVWTRRCEQCMKCAAEYALLREVGVNTEMWISNPFENETLEVFAEFLDESQRPEDLPYGRPILLSMLVAAEREPSIMEEYWPAAFRELGVFRDPAAAQELRTYCSTVAARPEVDAAVERWLTEG